MARGTPSTVRELLQYEQGFGLQTKIDQGATYTYIGKADTGVATSNGSWQIKRVTNASGDIAWADGNSDFDNIWDNRAALSYS